MTSNILIKVFFGVMVLAAMMLAVTHLGAEDETVENGIPGIGGGAINESTLSALNIEADTPEDTVKTLVTNVREAKAEMEILKEANASLRLNNEKLLAMEDSLMSRVRSEIKAESADVLNKTREALQEKNSELQRILARVEAQHQRREFARPPVDTAPDSRVQRRPTERTVWLRPMGSESEVSFSGDSVQRGVDKMPWTGALDRSFSQITGTGNRTKNDGADRSQVTGSASANNLQASRKALPIPAYTIAKNSTLVGATAFTALIGRVPVGQNVVDPYYFKVLIGKDNLVANGAEIPEVAYAVVSGRAVGDWTLGCVSGSVYSMTFVFDDGRIRTVPKPADITAGGSPTEDLKIGELSDAYGNPCVVGRKITNAGRYLAGRTVAVAAGAAASAAGTPESTTVVTGANGTEQITVNRGSRSDYILDQTLAGAASETAQWIRDRQSLEFDAVYVAPGQEVALHITEEIRIDYEPAGRFTHHRGFGQRRKSRALD